VLAAESDLGKVVVTVAGSSLGVLVVILIIWLTFRKKEKKKYEEEEAPNEIRWVDVEMIKLLQKCSTFVPEITLREM
jgi:NADH:ubiquinone oxidoreductase subunit 5 (subunit L)/multisubunit Na+/H+ antiporter MnhA subunit